MKTPLNQLDDCRRRTVEKELDEAIRELFVDCPTLCGFTVRDAATLGKAAADVLRDADVIVSDIALYPVRPFDDSGEIHNAIAGVLVDLIERSPHTLGLLNGRTFARTRQ
jgi:hypothetical protein